MTIRRAVKTLAAFDEAVERDQGNAFRANLKLVLPHMGDAYRTDEEPFRSHLGASQLGNDCGRAIWYGFRWATNKKFPGRIIRLFNRGHLEEGRIIALLLTIGVKVFQQDENGKQYRISDVGGHFGGSGDGVAQGIPDLPPGTYALLEFKTHNDKSFKELKEKGVREAKFEHFVQMQSYLRKMGLAVALYVAVNKNDDEIWAELVTLDTIFADQFIQRARTIILTQQPPTRINNSPGWFACKFCDHHPVCHKGAPPERNCRTCKHAVAKEDGAWTCESPVQRVKADQQGWEDPLVLDKHAQLKGCEDYEVF